MNKNRLHPVSLRTLFAPLCISLFCIRGGVKAQPNNCTFVETCNLVCNPATNDGVCPDGVVSPGINPTLYTLYGCTNFDGWYSANATPDYFTGTPPWSSVVPIDNPTMLGFRTYGIFGDCGANSAYSETIGGSVAVSANERYIFSFFRTIEPNEPETSNGGTNVAQLEELFVFLSNNAAYPPDVIPAQGCVGWLATNGTADRFDLYNEFNIGTPGWAQAVVCFQIPQTGFNYNRIIILGRETTGNMYTFIDRIDIIADHFPHGTDTLTHNCIDTLTIGDDHTCGAIPNLSYQWQESTDGINWTNISGANQPTYQVPNISQTTWYRLLRFMNTTNPIFGPLVNPNMANCVTDTATYR
ncbi:hypothetical protein C7N43_11680, partial [Sphingobacteriales bacterium UPWRP_1]